MTLIGLATLALDPSQCACPLYGMEGRWEEGESMHEAAWPLVACRGGNGQKATLKTPRLMHAYAHMRGLRNRRIGRVSLSGGL